MICVHVTQTYPQLTHTLSVSTDYRSFSARARSSGSIHSSDTQTQLQPLFITHSLTHSSRLVSSRPSLWEPWAQTLAMNSRFFHFLYFEDVASILRLRAGEQRAIRPITARLRERKHAALNTNTTSYQQRRTELSWRIVHFIQTKTLNGQHIVITNICSKVAHLKKSQTCDHLYVLSHRPNAIKTQKSTCMCA